MERQQCLSRVRAAESLSKLGVFKQRWPQLNGAIGTKPVISYERYLFRNFEVNEVSDFLICFFLYTEWFRKKIQRNSIHMSFDRCRYDRLDH
jgi:hypothetical protein